MHTFCNLKELDHTVTKFSFPFQPFVIFANLLTLKLSLACLFISLIELLKFSLRHLANGVLWNILLPEVGH